MAALSVRHVGVKDLVKVVAAVCDAVQSRVDIHAVEKRRSYETTWPDVVIDVKSVVHSSFCDESHVERVPVYLIAVVVLAVEEVEEWHGFFLSVMAALDYCAERYPSTACTNAVSSATSLAQLSISGPSM